ncbi:LPD7 domain-containing protein [Caballeronia grimmiae]|uniref:LPD7 domain-containing protein n=1 Tax=Caballeronia grimmiae TaxID=1071679 RepID=UPI0038B91407
MAIRPRDIRNYVAHIRGHEVHYSRRVVANNSARSTDSASNRAPVVAFVDKGREIEVRDWRSDESLLAALELSAQKWGALRVTGSDDYKARCAALAVEHGFRIVNPELQAPITQGLQAKRAIERESERAASSAGATFESRCPAAWPKFIGGTMRTLSGVRRAVKTPGRIALIPRGSMR